MAFQYPVKPWVDGQEIKINFHGEEVVIAKYDASKNLWTHLRVNDDGVFKYVTSCEVLLNRSCSDPCLPNIEWESIDNLQTALDYLYYWLFDETNGAIPRIDELAKDIENNADAIKELQDLIATIDGIGDFSQLIDRLDNIEDKVNNLNAADIQQAPLGGQEGFEIPDGVRKGTQQETNYFLNDKFESYLPLTGGKLTGRLSIAKEREDKNSIAFSIAGRINNGTEVVDDILLKSYQRLEGNAQPDYIAYYGSTGGANEILNRTTAQKEFAAKGTFEGSASDLEKRIADGEVIQAQITETISDALVVQANKVDKDGDTMTGALSFQLGTKTSPQFSISPNVVGAATNIFTTGGQLRLRTSHTENIDDRQGSHIILDPNGGDPVTSIFNVRDPANNRDAVPRIYVDGANETLQGQIDDGIETQQEILADIETLQNKVTALEGSVVDASWSFEIDDRAPRDGEFGLRVGGTTTPIWSAAEQIIISTTSLSGETFTFDKVTVNDVIRIGAADGSSAEYKVLTIAAPGAYFVDHLRSSGFPSDEQEYSFSFLSAFDPEGLATIDYVDAQDDTRVKKAGDSMSGNLTIENASFYVKDGSGTEKFRVQPSGFCRTRDLFRAERDDGGPALQARIGSTLNAEIRCDGKATFKNDVTISNGGEFTVNKSSGSAIQIQQSGTDKATIWADGTFETEKTSFTDKNLVTKKYVEDRISETVSTPAVEISTSSLPPAAKPRGHLLLTTSNNFYIYL